MHPSKVALEGPPSPTVAHSLRPSSIEGHPIYYGPKSNAFIRQAFQRNDQVEREKGWETRREEGREGRERCAYGKGKKKKKRREKNGGEKEDETSRDADGWRATIESCFSSYTNATAEEPLPEALRLGRA